MHFQTNSCTCSCLGFAWASLGPPWGGGQLFYFPMLQTSLTERLNDLPMLLSVGAHKDLDFDSLASKLVFFLAHQPHLCRVKICILV